MSMDVSLRQENCQSDRSSSLKQPAGNLMDNTNVGDLSSQSALQKPDSVWCMDVVEAEAQTLGSGSEVSEKSNSTSLRPSSLANDPGVILNEELKHKQDIAAEAGHPMLAVPIIGRTLGYDSEASDKLHRTSLGPHNLVNDPEGVHGEELKHKLGIVAGSKLDESRAQEPVISIDKLTTFSGDLSRKLTGEDMSPTVKDTKVSSCLELIGLQQEMSHELTQGTLVAQPHDEAEIPRVIHLGATVTEATEKYSNTGRGEEEILHPLDKVDDLGLPPKSEARYINPGHVGSPNHDGTNADLLEPTENYGQSVMGDEGTPIRSRKRRKSSTVASETSRVLRSKSKDKAKAPVSNNVAAEVTDAGDRKIKRKKRMKKDKVNEFSRTRNHLRYLLNRIKYEQNLIDVYSAEGWKGQSLEKIKPEKELQRAKSHILRYKLKIRDLFQRLDSSLAEGKIPASLFDSEGEIDSEDIFCAKCGSKDLPDDNDIILCDGACERGFHQFCLEPPLLKEDIPPDDEGWLCPGCDCKVDCINLLNDFHGKKISVLDSWEKVFPEAAAAASGKTLDDGSGLPSDDSDDDDYNPDKVKVEEELPDDETSSDESDYSSASDGLAASPTNKQGLGLSSEDSEDDDFDPDAADYDDQVKQESSSDFTSDSEDLGAVLSDNNSPHDSQGQTYHNGEEFEIGSARKSSLGDELSYLLNSSRSPISAKRHVERLEYKRLHDETYGVESSDSSDEDYEEAGGCKRQRNISAKIPGNKSAEAHNGLGSKPLDDNERTPKRARKKLDIKGTNNLSTSHGSSSEAGSGRRDKPFKKLGEVVTQKLLASFKENQYPKRPEKENMAKELGLTIQQVSKWFENARWSSRHSATMESNRMGSALKGQVSLLLAKDRSPDNVQPIVKEGACSRTLDKAGTIKENSGVKLCQTVDVVVEQLVTKEPDKPVSGTPRSSKRKTKKDNQASHQAKTLGPEIKFEGTTHVDSPNLQQVRRSCRLQSKDSNAAA